MGKELFVFSAFTTWGKEETCSFFCIYNMGTWEMGKELFVFSAFTTWEHGEWEKNCLFFLHLQQGERKKKDKNLKNIKIKKNYMN